MNKTTYLLVIIMIMSILTSCTKENLVKDSTISANLKSLDEDEYYNENSPVYLTDDLPFQYMYPISDFSLVSVIIEYELEESTEAEMIFATIMFVNNESIKLGFTSTNNNEALYWQYASIFGNDDVFYDDDGDDDNGGLCYADLRTRRFSKLMAWADQELEAGHTVVITKKGGVYHGHSY